MIDLVKEREAFELVFVETKSFEKMNEFCLGPLDKDESGDYKFNPTKWNFEIWIESAESKQAEIDQLQAENAALREKLQKIESGWISVDDRLPEFNVPVFAGEYINGEFVWWIFERYDDADGWLWSKYDGDLESDAYADDFNITHWMPLPQPPNAQGDRDEQDK